MISTHEGVQDAYGALDRIADRMERDHAPGWLEISERPVARPGTR